MDYREHVTRRNTIVKKLSSVIPEEHEKLELLSGLCKQSVAFAKQMEEIKLGMEAHLKLSLTYAEFEEALKHIAHNCMHAVLGSGKIKTRDFITDRESTMVKYIDLFLEYLKKRMNIDISDMTEEQKCMFSTVISFSGETP